MNNPVKILIVTCAFTLLASACNQAPEPLATPLSSTVTPVPTENRPMLPTATAFTPRESEAGEFFDADSGIRMTLPRNWEIEKIRDGFALANFYSPFGRIFMTLFDESLFQGDIQETTLENFNLFCSEFKDSRVLSEEPFEFDGGGVGWMVTGLATMDDGTRLEISATTLQSAGVSALLFTYAQEADFEKKLAEILDIIRTLQVEDVTMNGIPRSQALMLSGGESTNPRHYDPATTNSSGNDLVFSGLVALDPEMNLIPDLAETWEVSDDGKTYTFHLRENARFHNGRPVSAWDVLYSWDRAADPETESDTVLTYLGDIVGVKERHEGTATEISGLQVLDEKTLRVTIDEAKVYFLYKLTFPTAFVLDKENVESGSEWYRTPNGSGPYRLVRWERFRLKILERNDDYYLELPSIRFIVVKLFTGDPLRMYEAGQIDISGVSIYDLDRVLDPDEPLNKELISDVSLCTDYINFDTSQAPFDDPKVRQAFSMAFDRQKYIDIVMLGKSLPAVGLYPPALPGYDTNVKGLEYDPEKARALLAESTYGGAGKLPGIIFTTSGYGSFDDPMSAALAQMWEQNLGVEITIESLEPDVYYDEIKAGHHGQMMSNGWCADYPDPQNFADVLFHSEAEMNQSNYSNPELDQLLEAARAEQDTGKRIAMYQEVERIIIAEAPALFLDHSIDYVLVKPRVKGYVLTPISVALERYLRLEGE